MLHSPYLIVFFLQPDLGPAEDDFPIPDSCPTTLVGQREDSVQDQVIVVEGLQIPRDGLAISVNQGKPSPQQFADISCPGEQRFQNGPEPQLAIPEIGCQCHPKPGSMAAPN